MRKSVIRRAIPILAAWTLASPIAACTTHVEGPEWLGTREWIDSVEVVRNPAEPILPREAARAERLWSTATTDAEDPDSLWQEAAALTVGEDHIHVLDAMANRVYGVRASDGQWVSTLGRKGRGPGELARPLDVMMLGSAVAVLDGGKGTIERFTADGGTLDPIRLPSITFTAFPLDSTRVAVGGMRGTLILRAGSEPTAVQLEDPVAMPEGPGSSCRPLGHVADSLARWSCVAPHVQILDTLGRGVREILLGLEPVRTDEALLDEFLNEVRRTLASTNMASEEIERMMATTRDSYTYSRRWRRLRRDDVTGMLGFWEQAPDDLDPGPATLHLLRADGAWLATVGFDHRWVAFAMHDGNVYALERDPDTDLATLVAYRLVLE